MREQEYRAQNRVAQKMDCDGPSERSLAEGMDQRMSQRPAGQYGGSREHGRNGEGGRSGRKPGKRTARADGKSDAESGQDSYASSKYGRLQFREADGVPAEILEPESSGAEETAREP